MALTLNVGEMELAGFLQVEHDGGLDPANSGEYSEPQFSGSPAFTEGQSFVGDAVHNRLMSFPLILSGGSTDELYQLIREINAELGPGEEVEYRSGSASKSTFFTLQRGRLETKYEFWLDNAAKTRAMLHLWTRPFGTTGTYRTTLPSVAATGPQQLAVASSVLGDHFADGLLRVDSRPSYLASTLKPHAVIFGITAQPSYVGVWTAASIGTTVGATSAVIGASGAAASQYRGFVASPNSSEQNLFSIRMNPNTMNAYTGRQRIFMLARSRVAMASAPPVLSLNLEKGPGGAIPIGTVAATYSANWQLFDFGDLSLPNVPSFANPTGILYLSLHQSASSAASVIASPIMQVNALISIPLDTAAGVQIGTGWSGTVEGEGDPHLLFGRNRVLRNVSPTVLHRDESATLRGDYPELPPTGSPAASGSPQLVFLAGDPNAFVGNKPVGVQMAIRERFTYLR